MTDRADHERAQTDQDVSGGAQQQSGPAPPADPVTGAAARPAPPASGVPATPADPVTDYTDAGVPTLGYLRDKLDHRYGTALGATELAAAGEEAERHRQAAADRERAGRDRLEELRRSLRGDGGEPS